MNWKKMKVKKPLLITLSLIAISSIWLLFLDNNSILFTQANLRKKIKSLQSLKKYYEKKIKEDSIKIDLINKGDIKLLEKIGREELKMQKKNEVIYIISNSKSHPIYTDKKNIFD